MTRRDILKTVHEPFGDAFYYGPERLSERYENDEKARVESGFSESTFKTIFDRINRENTEVASVLCQQFSLVLNHMFPMLCLLYSVIVFCNAILFYRTQHSFTLFFSHA